MVAVRKIADWTSSYMWHAGALYGFESMEKIPSPFLAVKVCLDKSNEKISAWSNKPQRYRYFAHNIFTTA